MFILFGFGNQNKFEKNQNKSFAYLHLMYTNNGFLGTFFTLNYFMLPMLTPDTSVHCKGLKLAEGLKINDFPTKFPIFVHKKSAFLMREATVSKQQLSYFVLRLRTSRPKHTSCLYNERHTYTDTPVAHWAESRAVLY